MKIYAIGTWSEEGFVPMELFDRREAAELSRDHSCDEVEEYEVRSAPLRTQTRYLVWARDSGRPSDGQPFVVNELDEQYNAGVLGAIQRWPNGGGYAGSVTAPSIQEGRALVRAQVRSSSGE